MGVPWQCVGISNHPLRDRASEATSAYQISGYAKLVSAGDGETLNNQRDRDAAARGPCRLYGCRRHIAEYHRWGQRRARMVLREVSISISVRAKGP